MQRLYRLLQIASLAMLVLTHGIWAIFATRYTGWGTIGSLIYESLPFCQVPLLMLWLCLGRASAWLRVPIGLVAIVACVAISASAWRSEIVTLGLFMLAVQVLLTGGYLGYLRVAGYRLSRLSPSPKRFRVSIKQLLAITTVTAIIVAFGRTIRQTMASEGLIPFWIVATLLGTIIFAQFAAIIWATVCGQSVWLRTVAAVVSLVAMGSGVSWMVGRIDESLYVWLIFHASVTLTTTLILRLAGITIVSQAVASKPATRVVAATVPSLAPCS